MIRTLILRVVIDDARPELCGADCPLLLDEGNRARCGAFGDLEPVNKLDGRDLVYRRAQGCIEAAYA